MPKKQQNRKVIKRKAQRPKSKKGNSFLQDIGAVAKGVYNVAKVAAPLVGLLPFETSNQYAMTSGGSGAAINSVAAPVANATTTRTLKANIRRSKAGNMYVTHREYIGDIVLANNDLFNIQISQNINPGNGALFPWLANIAQNFEKFSFKRLHFIYEPQSSTSTPGTVMFAVDWDAKDTDPDSKVEMMSYESAVRSPTWFAASYTSAPHNLSTQKSYFVTNGGASPSGTDIHFYSVGKFLLATMSDSAVATTIGELYVDYEVELITPQLEYQCPSVALSATVGTSYGITTPLGSGSTVWTRYGDLGVQIKLNQTDNAASPGQGLLFPVAGQFTLAWRYSVGTFVGSNQTLLFGFIAGEGSEDIQTTFSSSSSASPNISSGFLFNDASGGTFGGVVNLNVKTPGATLFLRGTSAFTPNANSTAYFLITSTSPQVWGPSGTTIIPTLTIEPRNRRKFITSIQKYRTDERRKLNSLGPLRTEVGEEDRTVPSDHEISRPNYLELHNIMTDLKKVQNDWGLYLHFCIKENKPTKDFKTWIDSYPLSSTLKKFVSTYNVSVFKGIKHDFHLTHDESSKLKRMFSMIKLYQSDESGDLESQFQSVAIDDCAVYKK